MSTTLLRADRMTTGGDVVDDGWALFDGTTIAGTGAGQAPAADRVIEGALLTPGFVDIHCHGGRGGAFDDADPRGLALHREHGATRTMLSLVSAPVDALVEEVARCADLVERDPLILGIHLEGPFLADSHRGAHDPEALVAPTPDDVARLLDAGRGTIRQVTLAPELPGADAAIAQFVAAGVRVGVGHTDATYAQAEAAFASGASILTHAFNAMNGLHHRAPGPIPAALDAGATLELIADGTHVQDPMIRLLFELAPGRVALVTDATSAAGQPDGEYELGGLAVTVTDGVPRLTGTDAIAGSTLTMDRAVRVAAGAGVPLPDAVRAATLTPAAAIGRGDIGALRPGAAADAVLLGDDLDVREVWADGERIA